MNLPHRAGRAGATPYSADVVTTEDQDAAAGDGGPEHVVGVALVVQPPHRGAADVDREAIGGAVCLPVEQLCRIRRRHGVTA